MYLVEDGHFSDRMKQVPVLNTSLNSELFRCLNLRKAETLGPGLAGWSVGSSLLYQSSR